MERREILFPCATPRRKKGLGFGDGFIVCELSMTFSGCLVREKRGVGFSEAVRASGLCIKPKTKPSRMEMLKEMVRALGLNSEEILTKEALSIPHRTVITAGREESQIETLLKALKQKLKEELAEIPVLAPKTV